MTDATPLPVLEVAEQLRHTMSSEGAAVLVAPPGTGKTTAVPPLLAHEPWAQGRILVLEPRRLAARLAAARMAELDGTPVGERFGYSVRGERKVGPSTRVEVVTEGLLLRRLQADPELSGVSAVLLDEFHERSIDSDLALALLTDVRSSLRPDLRLLVMSATLDAAAVAALLGDGAPATIVEATAPLFPVEVRHRPGSAHERLEHRVATVVAEALATDPGDVLVFLPGRGEIRRTERALRSVVPGDVRIEQLHGSLSPAEQDAVVSERIGRGRRIVLSTALAETSVTVAGVGVVVDAGRRRTQRSDPRSGLPRLSTGPSSLASATQRAGRAGRLGPGVAYRLWAEADERHRPASDAPEIVEGDLAPLLLQVRAWGVSDVTSLRWMDEPPAPALESATKLLEQLGSLDEQGVLTGHGRLLAEVGFHPRLAAIALAAARSGELELGADLLAVLETSRSGDADLVDRVRTLTEGRASGDTRAAQRQWRSALRGLVRSTSATRASAPSQPGASTGTGTGTDADADLERPVGGLERQVGELLLAGFPDRVARRREGERTDDAGRTVSVFQLRGGVEVALSSDAHPLAVHRWLVVADLDAGEDTRSGRVHRAAPLHPDTLEGQLADQIETVELVDWDAQGVLRARREQRLGSIVVRSRPLAEPPAAAIADGLVALVRDEGLQLLGGHDTAAPLRARVAFCRALGHPVGLDWPDWSDDALREHASDWLGPRLRRARGRADLAKISLSQILGDSLEWTHRRALDELAPTSWRSTSGRTLALRYGAIDARADSVLTSARLRDLIGTDRHPTVADGRVPVTVELLSPAGRPLQRTTDLPGFWRGSYAQVRAEMRGRYPKHPWPERPWEPLS